MKIELRPAADRGLTRLDWLDSRHTFSFGEYHDPAQMGFGPLRVINDDRVAPGGGFATHGHRDMEIVTYVLDGALQHRDSLGNGSVIRPGDVQRMTAGQGVQHSEFNHSKSEPVHFLQIWIVPETRGLLPGYEQKSFATADGQDGMRLLASRTGRDGSVIVHRDVDLLVSTPQVGKSVRHTVRPGRVAWLHVARGQVRLASHDLSAGDGARIESSGELLIEATHPAELLLFDMAY